MHFPVSRTRHRTLLDRAETVETVDGSGDGSRSGNSSNMTSSAGIVAGARCTYAHCVPLGCTPRPLLPRCSAWRPGVSSCDVESTAALAHLAAGLPISASFQRHILRRNSRTVLWHITTRTCCCKVPQTLTTASAPITHQRATADRTSSSIPADAHLDMALLGTIANTLPSNARPRPARALIRAC
jgi:hypothetical protein